MASRDTNKEIENLIRAGNLTKEQIALLKKLQAENRKTIKAVEETSDSFEQMQEGLDNVGENFGLRLGSMFKKIQVEVEQTTRDISTMFSDLEASAPEIAANISAEFNDSFRSALPDPKDIQAKINLNSLISEFKSSFPEMGNEMQKAFKTGDIATFYRKFGDEGMKNLQNFMKDKKGFGGMKDWLKPGGQGEKSAINFRQQLESFEPAAQKTTKVIFNWGSLFKQIGSNLLNYMNLRSIIDHIMEFDNKLSNIKREFGVPVQGFAKADAAMQSMVKKGTQFGLTMDQSFGLVKNLAEEARTNNIQNVAETAKALAAIPQATGIAVETVGDIAGKMMFFGANAERAKHAFTSIQQSANRFGVNVTKVGKVFADVFPKYARMGFKGGEESLAKMAAKAEKMGMDLGKTLDMSDKFLDLNTALEASADLSLLGGAASQVSFTDLMRAAEEGGDALIDITGRMTSDIGKIGSDGLIKFTGMDRRRLKGIAEATGQDVEQLTNQLTSKLQDQAKKAALPPGVFNSLSDEEKDFLMSKMVNKGGKWKFEGLNGIQDLKGIGKNSIQAQMNAGKTEALNAEKRAKATQSFQETMTAFVQGLHNEMLAFRPILDQMKKIFGILQRGLDGFQKFIGNIFGAKAAAWAKPMLLLTTVLMLTFGPAAMARFFGGLFRAFTAPIKTLSGLGSKLGSAFKGGAGKKAAESLVPSSKMATPTSVPGKQAGMGGFTRSLPNPAQILAVAAAIVALGLALLMIGKGIQLAANGFANLVRAFNESKNAGIALAAIGVVMGGFIAMLYLMVGAVAALAAAGTAGAVGLLALGASLLMVGGGIYFAAKGFSMLVTSFMQLGKYSGSLFRAAAGMVTIGGALLLISPALLIFGAASLIAVPGMIAFGYLLGGLAAAKGINPKIISQVGDSMGSIAWGLVKLGLAAGPAVLAMVSATALMVVAVALKNISAVDVKKISQFGESLGAVSGTMIKGLIKLGAVAPFAVLAMVSAGSIWAISQALGRIKIIDLKKLQNFGDSMGLVGEKMMWGLVKLGAISPFVILGIVSAGGIWAISKALGSISIVDTKKIEAFGMSLGAVSAAMIFGLIKLGAISPFVVLGVVSAGGIYLISRMLKNIPLINTKALSANADALSSASLTYTFAFTKLIPVAALTPFALVAAAGIWGVTKMLKAVPVLNAKTLTQAADVVNEVSGPFGKAFFWLQGVGVLTPLALLAAVGILGVTKALSIVPKLNAASLISTATVLNQVSGPFGKSLFKLGLLGVLAPLAILAAAGILGITVMLNKITPLNVPVLIMTATTLAVVSGPFAKGLFKLGLAGFFAPLAMVASVGILAITKILNKITPLKAGVLIGAANVISIIAGPLAKGLLKLGLLSVVIAPAIVAAVGISAITKMLKSVPMLNPVLLMTNSKVLSFISMPFLKSMAKIATVSVFVAPAVVAAAGILAVTKTLKNVPFLNPVVLLTTASVLSIIAWPFTKSLGLLAPAALVVAPALAAAVGILGVTQILKSVPSLSPAVLLTTASVLSKIAWPFTKSLGALAPAALAILPALGVAKGILEVTKALFGVPALDSAKLLNASSVLSKIAKPFFVSLAKLGGSILQVAPAIGVAAGINQISKYLATVSTIKEKALITLSDTLSSISEPFFWSLGKLAGSAFTILPAIGVARGINQITKYFASTTPIDVNKLTNIALSLSITTPMLKKSFKDLALMGLAIVPAIAAALGLVKITNILKSAIPLDFKKMSNIAYTLSNTSGRIAKGLAKLAIVGLYVAPAIAAAASLSIVTNILTKAKYLDYKKLSNIGYTLNNTAGPIAKGLAKLSLVSLFAVPAIAAATSILIVTKLLSSAPDISLKKLSNIGNALSTTSLTLAKGLAKLSTISLVAVPAIVAAKSLALVTKLLSLTVDVNFKKMSNIGLTLNSTSGSIAKGLLKLSTAGFFASSAIVAAKGIFFVTNLLKNVSPINGKTLQNIGSTLSQTASSIASGIRKFSPIAIFILPAILGARGLVTLSKTISQITPITNKSLLSIGNVLNVTSGGILRGAIKLSATNLFLIPAILAAKQLVILSRLLNQIPLVTSKGISSVGNVTSSAAGQVFKGLIKLSSINLAILPAIIAAKSLVKLSKILSSVQQIQVKNLSSISTSLSSTSIPILKSLLKFATITFAIAPAILTAYGLRKLSRILLGIAIVDSKPIMGLADTLNASGRNMLTAVTAWSIMTPFIIPAIIAAAGVSRIFRTLSAVSKLDLKGLMLSTPILGGMTPTLLKFSSIGLIAPLLVSASLALVVLGRSLQRASIGFVTFASIPWTIIGTALPTLNGLLSTLISFGFKGLLAAPGILAMAATFGVLGRSLTGLSSNFALSTQSMSNYSKESERLKTVANAPKPVITDQTNRLKQSAISQPTITRTENVAGRTGANNVGGRSEAGVQVVQIKPIQIDLKLNGRQLQQLIVEANYNRT